MSKVAQEDRHCSVCFQPYGENVERVHLGDEIDLDDERMAKGPVKLVCSHTFCLVRVLRVVMFYSSSIVTV